MTAVAQWPSEAVRSATWKVAKEVAVEKWLTGSSDTTQMLMCVNAALDSAVPDLIAAERERIAAEAELMADELGWDGLTGELHEVRDYVKDLLHRLAAVARGES